MKAAAESAPAGTDAVAQTNTTPEGVMAVALTDVSLEGQTGAQTDSPPGENTTGAETNVPPGNADAATSADVTEDFEVTDRIGPERNSSRIKELERKGTGSGSFAGGSPVHHHYKTKIPPVLSKDTVAKIANIVVLARTDSAFLSALCHLPAHCSVFIFPPEDTDWADPEVSSKLSQANVLFSCSADAACMAAVLPHMPRLRWVHSLSAGVDHFLCVELQAHPAVLTNARGHYSSTLAEYCLFACLYFAKDVRRWQRNQEDKKWEKFNVGELRGATMGVVGFGDIGQTTGKLARAFGMRVVGLRRKAMPSQIADKVYGAEDIDKLFEESDYIVVAAALTNESRGMVGARQIARMKPSAVLINVGRGALINEEALMSAVEKGSIRGVALDVFTTEPLPKEHRMWNLDKDRCFISSHNADVTATFAHESTEAFATEVGNFLANKPVGFHSVSKVGGY